MSLGSDTLPSMLVNAFDASSAIILLQLSSGRLRQCTNNMVTEQTPLDVEEQQALLLSLGIAFEDRLYQPATSAPVSPAGIASTPDAEQAGPATAARVSSRVRQVSKRLSDASVEPSHHHQPPCQNARSYMVPQAAMHPLRIGCKLGEYRRGEQEGMRGRQQLSKLLHLLSLSHQHWRQCKVICVPGAWLASPGSHA